MKHTLFVASTGPGAGLTSVTIGLVRALDRQGIRVQFAKPISQAVDGDSGLHRYTTLLGDSIQAQKDEPISLSHAEQLTSEGNQDDLMEEVVALIRGSAGDSEVVVVEGLIPTAEHTYADTLNAAIAGALDADVLLVTRLGDGGVTELDDRLEITARPFGGLDDPKMVGAIINRINVPADQRRNVGTNLTPGPTSDPAKITDDLALIREHSKVFARPDFKLIGGIPWQQRLISPRVSDLAAHLNADILYPGEIEQRRVDRYFVVARTVPHMIHTLRAGALIVTPSDREDIILAVCMAALSGTQIAGLVLTGGYAPSAEVMDLCAQALATGLPLLQVDSDTYTTATRLQNYPNELPPNDTERIGWVMDHIARNIDSDWLRSYVDSSREPRMSPAAFRYLISELARQANKRIILPEGDEPRTIQAAVICHERGIARCVLLSNPDRVRQVAEDNGVELPDGLEILNPEQLRPRYVDLLVELRKHKGMARPMAEDQVRDNVMLGTLMLYKGEVDGLVSGAVHTTANTIRPALQLIKTRPGARLVSSIFFMALPEQVLVYGDCAINPDPTAAELADIAIQSADSAAAFNIPPRVAMISYSTGRSGSGSDVDKVREATAIAKGQRPDLPIDGPLQYDAAAIADVAAKKAPDSPVAGRATVFIFPDLNTGNTTYKAVQRSANVVSIGPMLQGLRKPVNDLSRGALVDDIVYTIALTAIQAERTSS